MFTAATKVLHRTRSRRSLFGITSRRPSELSYLLDTATGPERSELVAIISRNDAWDQV
jgi:hypothetical protein